MDESRKAQQLLADMTGAPECMQFGIRAGDAIFEILYPTHKRWTRTVTLEDGSRYNVMVERA